MRGSEIALGVGIATAFWCIAALSGLPASTAHSLLKDFATPAATLVGALAAGWVALKLGQGQISVARSQAEIADRTWQTANEKIVLELFERRAAIYEAIREAVGEVVWSGAAPDNTFSQYYRAIDRVPYFFGPEVQRYLEKLRLHMIDLDLANKMLNQENSDRGKWAQKIHDEFLEVADFYKAAPVLFEPYIKAHQKVA
ncbi:hypothetical protein [Tardiphaga sp. vice278]|uniref:hypothetical protein n=1 Tax=Tardiphaga sp. vice278 TaxID=2592815 RepID=UPI0011643878|nr:hypothetical protein [Tardiphaga sp. vice278]QDM14593.1 hypothetical protein FNL53_00450 [Tardiphaga sp. vice278]